MHHSEHAIRITACEGAGAARPVPAKEKAAMLSILRAVSGCWISAWSRFFIQSNRLPGWCGTWSPAWWKTWRTTWRNHW